MSTQKPPTEGASGRALLAAAVSMGAGLVLLQLHERRLVAEISGGEPVAVLTMVRDVPAGAPLLRDVLGVRAVPESYVERRSIRETDVETILGSKLTQGLRATELLLWTDLVEARPESRDLSSLIQPGSRAVTVQSSTLDGLLRPGDRVDVLPATRRAPVEPLQNLLVIAIGGDTGREPRAGSAPASRSAVTLTGTTEQATAVADASREGAVALALRNPDDLALVAPGAMGVTGATGTALPSGSRAGGALPAQEIEHVR